MKCSIDDNCSMRKNIIKYIILYDKIKDFYSTYE